MVCTIVLAEEGGEGGGHRMGRVDKQQRFKKNVAHMISCKNIFINGRLMVVNTFT